MNLEKGFTLIELMVVLAVLAIIVTIAVPNMSSFLDSNRLRGATGQFYSDVQYARSESIARNSNVSVSLTSNGNDSWCYGISINPVCDCTITNPANTSACTIKIDGVSVLKIGQSTEFSGIRLTTPTGSNQVVAAFDPTRGIATVTGSVVFKSVNDLETHVNVSALGKVSACTPTGHGNLKGYSPC